ncbi:MAG TPA: hypothetical protein DDY49_05015 [Paenibacillaceae bacterium]|nr:hypothetical protein [Paenibacillaceae bacterium]
MNIQSASLGILATPSKRYPPFSEKTHYAYLCAAGRKIGINVFVFLPTEVDFENKMVTGYQYNNYRWEKHLFPLPSFVYDRCSNRKKYRNQIQQLKAKPSVVFLGHVLPNKWKNYQHMIQHSGLLPYIPPTELIDSMHEIGQWLEDYQSVVIKPIQNSLGIGVMKIAQTDGYYTLQGRDYKNKILFKEFADQAALYSWLHSHLKNKTMIQPYLSLCTDEGVPFDIRVLVQKGGNGKWKETGRAVRAGVKNGITSNLCGGGKAFSVNEFLMKFFSQEEITEINQTIDSIVSELPSFIESRHGRLVELGIDIGVDKNGEVWIIEINSKPGRASFRKINKGAYYNQARLNPLKYAYFLSRNLVGVKE